MMFPKQFVEEIKERLNTSEIVRKRVELKQRGNEFSGLCPFHNEKTPSFTVNDEKGFYHCFGCGAHGNVFDFTMRTEGLSFPEAIESLALQAGMQLPKPDKKLAAQYDRYARLTKCAETACNWFQANLAKTIGSNARDYLKNRGLSPETISKFKLGYAPDARGDLQKHLEEQGFNLQEMQEIGLIKNGYEYFRGRVIFPITNAKGITIAFGGRILGEGEPKYLNSPETEIFHKRKTLFGKAIARKPSFETKELIITEGYMDVISLNHAGFAHAVAPLGTAVSAEHLEEMWKMAKVPTMCFDGDNAGRLAMIRAANTALPILRAGYSLKFVTLPKGQDPDDVVKKDRKQFENLLAQAKPLSEILYLAESEKTPNQTPEQQADLKSRLNKLAQQIKDSEVSRNYHSYFSQRHWEDSKNSKKSIQTTKTSDKVTHLINKSAESEPVRALEGYITGMILSFPQLLNSQHTQEDFVKIDFLHAEFDNIRQNVLENITLDGELDTEKLNTIYDKDNNTKRLISSAAAYAKRFTSPNDAWNSLFEQYQQEIIAKEHENLSVDSEEEFLRVQKQTEQLAESKAKIDAAQAD